MIKKPRLGHAMPEFGSKYFLEVLALQNVDIASGCNPVYYQGKLIIKN